MEITVYGTGCVKCKKLFETVRDAADELKCSCTVNKIDDIQKIIELGVMEVPVLVIDDTIVAKGHVPSKEKIIAIIKGKQNA